MIEESPWGDYYGKKISPQALSKLLKPHRIKTMSVKVDGKTVRGYKAEQFTEAFSRVLGVTSVTSVTSESLSQAGGNAGNAYHAGGVPILGDEMYPVLLADAARDGHITAHEFGWRNTLHKKVERAREEH